MYGAIQMDSPCFLIIEEIAAMGDSKSYIKGKHILAVDDEEDVSGNHRRYSGRGGRGSRFEL